MQIKLDEKFETNFNFILEYIAKDKISAAKDFRKKLLEQIKYLPNFPYKYRKSFYFDDDEVRDMVFKGYTIVYAIDLDNNLIIILDIFNKNKPPLSSRYNKSSDDE